MIYYTFLISDIIFFLDVYFISYHYKERQRKECNSLHYSERANCMWVYIKEVLIVNHMPLFSQCFIPTLPYAHQRSHQVISWLFFKIVFHWPINIFNKQKIYRWYIILSVFIMYEVRIMSSFALSSKHLYLDSFSPTETQHWGLLKLLV